MKKIVMIDLKYPYGKSQIYLGGSTISVMARFIKMGYQVAHINLNVENINDQLIQDKISQADLFGVSVIGAPYIPSAIELAKILSKYGKPILFGGQVIERLQKDQFSILFTGTTAKQMITDDDITRALGCSHSELPNAYAISYI